MDAPNTVRDQLDLRGILSILVASRWLVISITVLCTAVAGTAAFLVPKAYEASITISPVGNTSSASQLGGLGALASQFSGVAALAGVSLGGDSKKAESVAVLQSEALT